jgi:hypothetical protein
MVAEHIRSKRRRKPSPQGRECHDHLFARLKGFCHIFSRFGEARGRVLAFFYFAFIIEALR